ncbi:hypothetical protein N836_04095 [Leptolyngbya sp. Heron Island J]|uniref:hypothetical protein n=1 Tax=Leptolyngbya sp. Heron Island J TaxID=1385935 RepID=UPI0003B98F05|nr:hypothetical protein [Leptolyngbya sp. Heron Island J]ESA37185.1 hypothetical protein N836_04095 [Leptolyngbya sp. Heron Island J]
MQVKSPQRHLGIYLLLGILACAVAVALKLIVVWSVDSYVYSLPIVGGVLATLEVAELASPILLAILGLTLGALTYYLPAGSNLAVRLLLLGLTLPLVLLLGHRVRHNRWIQQVANQDNLSLSQAQQVTNEFLQQETSNSGSLGFYLYTATRANPPTRLNNLATIDDNNLLQNQLTDLGQRQTGLLGLVFKLYNWLFTLAGWGIRAIYALLSGFMGLSYFYRGELWANRQRRQ